MSRAYAVERNNISPALGALGKKLGSSEPMQGILNAARSVIKMRTLAGESLTGGVFPAYSMRRYYAPVAKRPPGYPAPSGGRKNALRGGRRLKSVAYDTGYGQYKAGIGRGSHPQLSVSNSMLDSMQGAVESPSRGVIFYANAHAAAKAHGHHMGKYPHFGLRNNERPRLYQAHAEVLRRVRGVN